MKNNKVLFFSLSAVLLLIVVAYMLNKGESPVLKEVKLIDVDNEWVQLAKASPDDFRKKVIQLANKKNDEVLSIANQLQDHPSVIVRAAAVEALGFLEDSEQALVLLKKALVSPEKVVRTGAIRGLARNKSKAREDLILGHIHENNPPIEELVEVYSTLGRISGGENKDIAIDNLIDIANRGHEALHQRALSNVANIAPHAPQLVELLRSKLKKLDSESEIYLAMQHLSAIKDEWFIAKLPAILKAKSPQLRMGAARALALSCHPKRWKLLKKSIMVEKQTEVIAVLIDVPKMLLGQEAIDFLKVVIEKKQLSNKLLNKANENLAFAEKNIKNGICRARKAL